MRRWRLAVTAIVASTSYAAFSADIAIANAGFEDPVQKKAPFFSDDATGWSIFDMSLTGAGVWNPTAAGIKYFNARAGYGGDQVGYLNANVMMGQNLGVKLEEGKKYELSTLLGWRLDQKGDPAKGVLAVLSGMTVLATLKLDASTVKNGTFATKSMEWTADSDSDETITIQYYQQSGGQLDVDQPKLTVVPGPPAPACLLAAALPLARRRRLGKRQHPPGRSPSRGAIGN